MNREITHTIDGLVEDVEALVSMGFDASTAVEIIKTAAIMRLAECVQNNSYKGFPELKVSGWMEISEEQ